MKAAKIFPIILIALDVGAAVVYACCGDWKHMTYWLAAATPEFSILQPLQK